MVVPHRGVLEDGTDWLETMQKLEAEGADVLGFNCGRGPQTMMPLLKEMVGKVKVEDL